MGKQRSFSSTMPKLTESVMIAETISLGILALPKALSTLGLIPYLDTPSGTIENLQKATTDFVNQGHLDDHCRWHHLHVHRLYHW